MEIESLLDIADGQDDFLARMSARHQARMQRSITRLERRIVDRMSSLSTTDAGNLVGPRVNLTQAQKAHADLTQIFDEEYGEGVRSVLGEYERALPQIQAQYEAMGAAAEFTGVDREMMDTLKRRDFAEYERFGQQAQDRIATAMYDNVVAQSPFSAMVATIAGALSGHVDARGMPMSRYAEQMANDGIMNFHNAVNMKKGRDLGFKSFLYYGNVIKDSRDFCIRRAGNVYTEEQIKGWTEPWQGKSGPAMTHRGGYNCRHHWQPVRPGWLPEEGIEVESWFDRSQVQSIGSLPKEISESAMFKVFREWKRAELIDKKPMTGKQIHEKLGLTIKKSSVDSHISRWKKGMNYPKGWESIIKEIEDELGGVGPSPIIVPPPPPPVIPIKPVIVKPVAPAPPVPAGAISRLPELTNRENGFRVWKSRDGKISAKEMAEYFGGEVSPVTTGRWLTEWKQGIKYPKNWEELVKGLGLESTTTTPAIDAVTAASVEATEKITWDAVKDAEQRADAAIAKLEAELKALRDAEKGNYLSKKTPSLSDELSDKITVGSRTARIGEDISGVRAIDDYQTYTATMTDIVNPASERIKELKREIREQVRTLLELDERTKPTLFVPAKTASQAKSFYADVQSRRALFEKTYKRYGFDSKVPSAYRARGIQYYYEQSVADSVSNTGLTQKSYYTQLFEHAKAEKRARYQWLKLADEKTYQVEHRKVTDSLVKAQPKMEAEAKKRFIQTCKDKTALALDFCPIDLLESMAEQNYEIRFIQGQGRAFYDSHKLCTMYFDNDVKEGWDAISHEWGHAIDGFFGQDFNIGRAGEKWGGVRFETFAHQDDYTDFSSWFKKNHKGTIGSLGQDGRFYEDNWLLDYEGRIYNNGGDGMEWWSCNVQRYGYNRAKLNSAAFTDQLAEQNVFLAANDYAKTWDRAKQVYPELTAYIEKIFSGRTMLY